MFVMQKEGQPLDTHRETKPKPHSQNTDQRWTHKTNQNQRQCRYETGRSLISSPIYPTNGRNKQGAIELPNIDSENKIGDLQWVDDVALMSFDEKELQDLLDITDKTAKRCRIKFGKKKSKVLNIGKKETENPTFKLGDMELDLTETNEYLGETINNKGNIESHIKKIKGKAEVAYQTIWIIAGSKKFNYFDMETT